MMLIGRAGVAEPPSSSAYDGQAIGASDRQESNVNMITAPYCALAFRARPGEVVSP
jgi:hypothetical protein